jgi:hypothetical protein
MPNESLFSMIVTGQLLGYEPSVDSGQPVAEDRPCQCYEKMYALGKASRNSGYVGLVSYDPQRGNTGSHPSKCCFTPTRILRTHSRQQSSSQSGSAARPIQAMSNFEVEPCSSFGKFGFAFLGDLRVKIISEPCPLPDLLGGEGLLALRGCRVR